MNNPEVSIVVPIYNSQQYLDKCIKSILNQTFKDFELLLINDGSTDCSIEICKKYLEIDDRVVLISKMNTGSSDTRNVGISKSKGKYICFIDSDDWIEFTMIEEKIKLIKQYNVDMVISGISIDKMDNYGNVNSTINNYKSSIWNTVDMLQDNIIELFPNALINSSCNKLYRLELLKSTGAKFEDTNIGEDTLFNLGIIRHMTGVVITDKSYYHYMKYPNNITLTRRIIEDAYERYIYIHKAMEDIFNYWGKKSQIIDRKIKETMFCQYYSTTLKILRADKNVYSYKCKKEMLDQGLKENIVLDAFKYNKSFSYKEEILRFTIRKRFYRVSTLLLKLSRIKNK